MNSSTADQGENQQNQHYNPNTAASVEVPALVRTPTADGDGSNLLVGVGVGGRSGGASQSSSASSSPLVIIGDGGVGFFANNASNGITVGAAPTTATTTLFNTITIASNEYANINGSAVAGRTNSSGIISNRLASRSGSASIDLQQAQATSVVMKAGGGGLAGNGRLAHGGHHHGDGSYYYGGNHQHYKSSTSAGGSASSNNYLAPGGSGHSPSPSLLGGGGIASVSVAAKGVGMMIGGSGGGNAQQQQTAVGLPLGQVATGHGGGGVPPHRHTVIRKSRPTNNNRSNNSTNKDSFSSHNSSSYRSRYFWWLPSITTAVLLILIGLALAILSHLRGINTEKVIIEERLQYKTSIPVHLWSLYGLKHDLTSSGFADRKAGKGGGSSDESMSSARTRDGPIIRMHPAVEADQAALEEGGGAGGENGQQDGGRDGPEGGSSLLEPAPQRDPSQPILNRLRWKQLAALANSHNNNEKAKGGAVPLADAEEVTEGVVPPPAEAAPLPPPPPPAAGFDPIVPPTAVAPVVTTEVPSVVAPAQQPAPLPQKVIPAAQSSSSTNTKPKTKSNRNNTNKPRKRIVVWSKGSWMRFSVAEDGTTADRRAKDTAMAAKGALGQHYLQQNHRFSPAALAKLYNNVSVTQHTTIGVPRPYCTPFPAVTGLGARCNLLDIPTPKAGVNGGGGADAVIAPAVQKLADSGADTSRFAIRVEAFPMRFTFDVFEGVRVHAVKCIAGCVGAELKQLARGKRKRNVAADRAGEGNSQALEADTTNPNSVVGVIIPTENDLTKRCVSSLANCMIAFDFLVSYDGPWHEHLGDADAEVSGDGNAEATSSNSAASVKSSSSASANIMPTDALPPVCFHSVGDWGSADAAAVAAQMAIDAEKHFVKFVVSTGDNFYPMGVNTITDPLWIDAFERPFSSPFMKNVRWYICAGNHDQWGLAAQLEYGKVQPRWYFPSLFYHNEMPLYAQVEAKDEEILKRAVGLGGGALSTFKESSSTSRNSAPKTTVSTSIFFTVLDFMGRAKKEQMEYLDVAFAKRYGLLGGVPSVWNRNPAGRGKTGQQQSSETTLQNGQSPPAGGTPPSTRPKKFLWRGVLNHAVLYGGGYHARVEGFFMRNMLTHAIDKHRVHFHLGGHDHTLEVLRAKSTDYFVSGGGGGAGDHFTNWTAESLYTPPPNTSARGFMRHCVYGHDRMETTVIAVNGTELFVHITPFDN